MNCSLPAALKSMIVSGTKMISETSLVTNMDEKNTEKTRKNERAVTLLMLPARRSTGLNMFSLLKPSRTVSIRNRVPRVRQSMSLRSSRDGGVMKSDMTAARRGCLKT